MLEFFRRSPKNEYDKAGSVVIKLDELIGKMDAVGVKDLTRYLDAQSRFARAKAKLEPLRYGKLMERSTRFQEIRNGSPEQKIQFCMEMAKHWFAEADRHSISADKGDQTAANTLSGDSTQAGGWLFLASTIK